MHSIQNMLIQYVNTRNIPGKNKNKYWYTKYIRVHRIIKNLLAHGNTYTTIIAPNTRIHDTQNLDTRVKL